MWIGHIIKGTGILTTVLQATVEGEKKRRKKRLKVMDDIRSEDTKTQWNRQESGILERQTMAAFEIC